MGNQIEIVEKLRKELKALEGDLTGLNKVLFNISTSANKTAKSFSDIKAPKEVEQKIKDIADSEELLLQTQKQRKKTQEDLIKTTARLNTALDETNQALINQRLDLQQQNKLLKDSAVLSSRYTSELQKATVIRNKLARTIQDLNLKRSLGIKLSDKEQKELKQSTTEFQKYDKAIRNARKSVGRFQDNVGNYPKLLGSITDLTKGLVGSFGIIEGLRLSFDFAKEAVALAREAKGVEFAFKRLGASGEEAFQNIKKSTRGLISNLDIKRSLNEFNNFNISLEQTDTLFEFLAVRAAQTGRSIDSLKDSLVEGLSKESKLRIDNLGISAAKLNDELKKTPDFVAAVANIAKEEISKAGSILDDAANSQEKFNAAFENFKVSAGSGFIADITNSFFNLGTAITQTISDINDASDGFVSFFSNISNVLQGNSLLVKTQAEVNKEIRKRSDLTNEIIPLLKKEALENLELRKSKGQVYNADLELLAIEASLKDRKDKLLDTSSKELLLLLKSLQPKKENKKIIEGTTKEIEKRNKAVALSIALAEKSNKDVNVATESLKALKDLFKDDDSFALPEIDIEATQQKVEEFTKAVSDDLIKAFDKELLQESLGDLAGTIEQFTGANGQVFVNFFEQITKEGVNSFESIADVATASFDVIGEAVNAFYQSKIQQYETDLEANNDYYSELLNNDQLTEDERKRLELDRDAREKEILDKKKKEQKKQAQINKALAVADILVSTAQGIASAASKVVTLPLIPLIASIGAAQLGIALATPIPQFAEGGTMDHDGLMMINDHSSGRMEVVERDGKFLMTDKKNAIVEGKKGDVIHKDAKEYFNSLSDNDISENASRHAMLATLQNQNYLIHKLDNKKVIDGNKLNADRIIKAINSKKTKFNLKQNIDLGRDINFANRLNNTL